MQDHGQSQELHVHKVFYRNRGPSVAIYGISSVRPDATVHGNSLEATRCVMTKTTRRALVLISEFQEKPDRSTDGEESKRSLIKSLMEQILESLNQDKLMAEIVSKRRRKVEPRYLPGCEEHCSTTWQS